MYRIVVYETPTFIAGSTGSTIGYPLSVDGTLSFSFQFSPVTLTSSANPSYVDQSVTFSAVVFGADEPVSRRHLEERNFLNCGELFWKPELPSRELRTSRSGRAAKPLQYGGCFKFEALNSRSGSHAHGDCEFGRVDSDRNRNV